MLFVAASLTSANHNLINVSLAKTLWQNALLFHKAGTRDVIVKFNVVCRYYGWNIYAQERIDVYSPDTVAEMPFSFIYKYSNRLS